jgi:TrmH family RNA methyltransferase
MITSLTNDKVKTVRRLQRDKRFRRRERAFVIEGDRWLAEFARPAHTPRLILYTAAWRDQADHAAILHQVAAPAQPVSEEVMAAMSDVETPPGVLAVIPMQPLPLPPRPFLYLILDQVQNPGNLGTMLRAASAAGADAVLLGPGCVDPYNPKVVRGSMGALLRLPVHDLSWEEIEAETKGMGVWLADVGGERPYTAVEWTQPNALIIGNEAWGAGAAARRLADAAVAIPMRDATESLNAAIAAGVILFEAARQRRVGDNA